MADRLEATPNSVLIYYYHQEPCPGPQSKPGITKNIKLYDDPGTREIWMDVFLLI